MFTQSLSPAIPLQARPAARAATDIELIARIAAGDALAMRVLYARHNLRVYRFVLRLTGNPSVAEDVISETFLDVWRQAGRFEGRSAVSTWLLAIARHKGYAAMRRRTEEALDEDMAATIADPADDDAAPLGLARRAGGKRHPPDARSRGLVAAGPDRRHDVPDEVEDVEPGRHLSSGLGHLRGIQLGDVLPRRDIRADDGPGRCPDEEVRGGQVEAGVREAGEHSGLPGDPGDATTAEHERAAPVRHAPMLSRALRGRSPAEHAGTGVAPNVLARERTGTRTFWSVLR